MRGSQLTRSIGGSRIRASTGESAQDSASPTDFFHPQATAHTSLALSPGTTFSVYGEVDTVLGGVTYTFLGSFTTPSESVIDASQGNGNLPGYNGDNQA
jgi:hypothetical protein